MFGIVLHEMKRFKSNLNDKLMFITWLSAVIPYEIDKSSAKSENLKSESSFNVLESAFEEFHKFTCIRFVPRTNQKNYIKFKNHYLSIVDKIGGEQKLFFFFFNNLYHRGVVHQLMYAIGFCHEHQRIHRNKSIMRNPL